ncbi:MAG: MATE family efflux transporter [Acidobacteria bacterium]|nr:MATE family efflux transporter [Acidobacteriota bacterium]
MLVLRGRVESYWSGPGGGREVLALAYPLILSQVSFTVQTSIDRIFLTWYSAEALAGAVTGLFATWSLIALFLGTGEYLTTFVAQYFGAGRHERIGPAVWQGIYFSLLAGLLTASLAPLAGPFFALAGHDPTVRAHETAYAGVLMTGAFPVVLMATLSTFFAGRGQTLVVLLVNLGATVVNVVLDYFWIFGHGGFPRAGVTGAAWATVVSQGLGAAAFFALMIRRRYRSDFATLAGWRPEPQLLGRLLRFGLPAGLHYSLEVLAFSLFMLIVGRVGTDALAASGIAFTLNLIVFMPMLGLGVAVSSLVGRYLGADRPDLARRSTWSAFWASLAYMTLCGLVYVLAPRLLLAPFAAGADPASFGAVADLTVVLLRFVAVYSIFDMMNVVFAAALKGAGDTVYPLVASVVLSWVTMLGPAWVACVVLGLGIYAAWITASAYVVAIGLLLLRRFRAGKWTSLRVIEPPAAPGLEAVAEA